MHYVLRHKLTKRYVRSIDMDNTNFSYEDLPVNATIFDSKYFESSDIFEDNPDRLFWEIRPIIMKFAERQPMTLNSTEKIILSELSGTVLNKDMYREDVMTILGIPQDYQRTPVIGNIVDWINRNFSRIPKVGDIVCFHSQIEGPIISRGHHVTSVDKNQRLVWITDKGAVSFDVISEDMDAHEYKT